jgi:toxin ParE1/3/4
VSAFRLTPAAQTDLSLIWDFTEDHWGADQASTYLAEIRIAIERIADRPDRGRACDEIREGYRRYAIGSHLIFYKESGAGIVVVRVLHQRMDPSRHF